MDLNLFTKPSLREYLLSNLFGNCLRKPYVYSPFLFELTHSLFREKNHIPRVFVRNNQEQLLKTAPVWGSETRLNKQVKNVLRKSGKWEVHRGFWKPPIYSWEYGGSCALFVLCAWLWKTSEGLNLSVGWP